MLIGRRFFGLRNERRAPCQVTRRSRSFWRAAGLGCGTTVGRNRLANRGRAALDEPEILGILSYHQSVRAENLGVLQSIFTARDVSNRANAKEVSAQSAYFQ